MREAKAKRRADAFQGQAGRFPEAEDEQDFQVLGSRIYKLVIVIENQGYDKIAGDRILIHVLIIFIKCKDRRKHY